MTFKAAITKLTKTIQTHPNNEVKNKAMLITDRLLFLAKKLEQHYHTNQNNGVIHKCNNDLLALEKIAHEICNLLHKDTNHELDEATIAEFRKLASATIDEASQNKLLAEQVSTGISVGLTLITGLLGALPSNIPDTVRWVAFGVGGLSFVTAGILSAVIVKGDKYELKKLMLDLLEELLALMTPKEVPKLDFISSSSVTFFRPGSYDKCISKLHKANSDYVFNELEEGRAESKDNDMDAMDEKTQEEFALGNGEYLHEVPLSP